VERQYHPAYKWAYIAVIAVSSFLYGYGVIRWWTSVGLTLAASLLLWVLFHFHHDWPAESDGRR
jgi:hypothetical protein